MLADGFLDFGIDIDVWPWVWLGVAVIFTLVELAFIGGTFVLLPYAISAFAAAVLAFYDVAIEIQWATFIGGGTLILVVLLRWVRGFLKQNTLPTGVGADRLVGTTGIVTVAVEPGDVSRRGRVIVEGETWGALAENDAAIPAGARVRIVAVVGTRVLIAPVRVVGAEPPNDSADPADREDAT